MLEKAQTLVSGDFDQDQVASEQSKTIKQFLNFMLRVTKVFIWAGIKAAKTEEQAEQLTLLRKRSSVQEAEQQKAKQAAKEAREAAKLKDGFEHYEGKDENWSVPYKTD